MPIQELQNQQGALGTILGTVGGYLAANPARKAKQAQQEYQQKRDAASDARADQQAKLYADNVTSEIKSRDASTASNAANDANTQLQRGLFTKYAALVKAGPPKGMDPQRWAASLQAQANADGLTDENLRRQLVEDGAAAVAASAPKLSDVEHGLPQPVTSGKKAWTPQQMSQHYLQAAARAMNSTLPDDQKKLIVGQYQKMAADVLAQQTAAERERHDRAVENNQGRAITTRVEIADRRSTRGGGGGANAELSDRGAKIYNDAMSAPNEKAALRIVESAGLSAREEARVRRNVMDQFRPDPVGHDTSGLSRHGREMYTRDDKAWSINFLRDPDNAGPEPDPSDPKYEKMSDALRAPGGGGGGGGAPAGNAGGTATATVMRRRIASGPHKGGVAESVDGGKTWHLAQ